MIPNGSGVGGGSGTVGLAFNGQNNTSNGRRRLAAERAAIRQRVRDDLARQQNAIRRQKEFTEKTRLWNEMLTYWDQLGSTPKVKDLCSKGIPPNIRGKVWPLLVGNELQVTEALFEDLNHKVQVLFRENVMTASSRRNEKIFETSIHSSYVLKGSFSDQQDADNQYRTFSADIPIPAIPPDAIDVTEEAWFENEREGSLDQATLSMIQRQLFGQHGYKPESHDIIAHGRSDDIPISNPSTPLPATEQDVVPQLHDQGNEGKALTVDLEPPGTPLSVSANTVNNDLDSPLPFHIDMSPSRAIPDRPQYDTLKDCEETSPNSSKHNSLVPGLASPSLMTPPHRTKHSNHFLVQAGLLPETKNSKPITPDEAHTNEQLEKVFKAVSLIQWDLPRTFPTLAFFHDGGAMHTGLERVLLCYALYRPNIGYVQGMSFLVATLLLYMDEYEAFKSLANLLSNRLYSDFYGFKKHAIDGYVKCFDYYFKKFLPLLFNHMNREGVTSEMFLMDWYLSLFTKALPLEVAAQVWDNYLCEGEVFLLCVGLGILKMYAPILSTYSVEQISPFLLHLPEDIRCDELFVYISQIKIPRKNYEKVRTETMQQCLDEEIRSSQSSRMSSFRSAVRSSLVRQKPQESPADNDATKSASNTPTTTESSKAKDRRKSKGSDCISS